MKKRQTNCEYLDEEIAFVQNEILKTIDLFQKWGDKLYSLKQLKLQLICPEDTSPEAIERNKKMLESLKEEML